MEDLDYRIAKLSLAADDILIVKCATQISEETALKIREQLNRAIDHKHVLVLGSDIDLAVLTRAEIEARAA